MFSETVLKPPTTQATYLKKPKKEKVPPFFIKEYNSVASVVIMDSEQIDNSMSEKVGFMEGEEIEKRVKRSRGEENGSLE